jgi:hypothetical protein
MRPRAGRARTTGIRRAAAGLGASVVATAVLVVLAAGPAAAKGPTAVSIGRPGEERVALATAGVHGEPGDPGPAGQAGGGGSALAALAADLGIWETTGEGSALMTRPPAAELGPALVVEWEMYNAMPDRDAAPRVVQTLYLHAAGGPLVYTRPGQRFFQSQVTKAGWFRAPERLATTLADLGVEYDVRLPEPAAEPGPAPAPAAARRDPAAAGGTGAVPALPVTVALATGGGLAVGWSLRRRSWTPAATGPGC